MPHANIWIRKEDWSKWQAIEDKPEWLHKVMHQIPEPREDPPIEDIEFSDLSVHDQAVVVQQDRGVSPGPAVNTRRLSNGLCKIHDLPLDDRGRCLQKGCKYG